jgi:DeoR/GlpR family transcriptional regulator of sugar metabolism
MMDLAEEVFLLVDHSKFGERAAVYQADLSEVDVLITDAGIDATVADDLRKLGVTVETAG